MMEALANFILKFIFKINNYGLKMNNLQMGNIFIIITNKI